MKVNYLRARGMSSIKEQGDLFWTLTHQDTQSVILTRFFEICCSQIVYSWYHSAATDGVCEQNTLTRHIFSWMHALISMSHVTLAQDGCPHHVIHASRALFVLAPLRLSTLHCSPSLSSSFFILLIFIFIFIFHVGRFGGEVHLCASANEELGTLADNNHLTGYEPNDLHILETNEKIIQESSGDNRSLNLHDLEFDDYTIGRALSSPLFTQEREDPASRRQAYHSLEESLLPSQSLSVCHVRTGRLVSDEFGSLISNVKANPRRDS